MPEVRAARIRPDVVFRVLDEGGVVVNLVTDDIFELNETATAIWVGIASGASTDQIVASLVQDFEVTESAARTATGALLDTLRQRQLVS